ncbi:hypothetical protein [Tolumonas auensis]|uniref:hypothetical protein n=1 Tax=Tolumonas auensis TaxID=43948 RepID=UPI002AA6679A|nr:hypothetical protein [Tolumonas auensis]
MRHIFILLGLLSAPMLSSAGELPPVDAIIHYTTTETTEEGVVKTLRYQDRWIRDGQTIWSERLIPAGIRTEAEHNEHNEMQAPHDHFNYQTSAQWLTNNADGSLTLNYVDPVHKAIVYYPPGEYGQANFVPDWTLHAHIFKPAALQKMTRLDKPAPAGATWYKQENKETELTLLWSDTLQIPLSLEKKTKNGFHHYQMQIEPAKQAATPRPWLTLAKYEKKEVSDFLD